MRTKNIMWGGSKTWRKWAGNISSWNYSNCIQVSDSFGVMIFCCYPFSVSSIFASNAAQVGVATYFEPEAIVRINLMWFLNIHSLPDPQLKRPQHKRHIEYDEAHQNAVNCTEAYSQCPNSVWSSWFMMESMADLYKHMHWMRATLSAPGAVLSVTYSCSCSFHRFANIVPLLVPPPPCYLWMYRIILLLRINGK